jgi:hypothetical protein
MTIIGNFVKVFSSVNGRGRFKRDFGSHLGCKHIEPGTKMQQDLNLLWFVDNFYTKLTLSTNNAHLVKKTGVELAQAEKKSGASPRLE